jgi:hypothetical protein
MGKRNGICWFGNKRMDIMTTSISIADLGWVPGFMLYRHEGKFPQDGDGTGRYPIDSCSYGNAYFKKNSEQGLIDYFFRTRED